MAPRFGNIFYRCTICCGCPAWLTSASILIVTIVNNIRLLLPYISNLKLFQDGSDKSHVDNLLLTDLTLTIFDLSFAIIGFWGILKRAPLSLLAYILWSIFLMSATAYNIYLMSSEEIMKKSSPLDFYRLLLCHILGFDCEKSSSIGIMEILLSLPILIKGFFTMLVYAYYRTMVEADLQEQQNQIDMENFDIMIQTRVNEVVTSCMNKAQGSKTRLKQYYQMK